jgi:subtilase family serine protease
MLRGRTMKKASTIIFKHFLLSSAILFAFPGLRVSAQTKPDSASATQAEAVPARITQAIDETQLTTLKGNVHPLARPEFDQGIVSDATPMKRMMLLLQRSAEQETALRQLMDEQLSKDSPNFHKWLTPGQFAQQFGPADADIQTVTDWLTRQGFQEIKVGTGRTAIEFSGNVGQVGNTFHTEIHLYLVDGDMRQANASDVQIPAALTPVVAGIVSLNNFPKKSMRHTVGAFTRTADGRVISQLTGSTNQFFALAPADFAKIYNIPSTLNGTGSKIAIVGFSDINIQDVRDFRTLFGLPANDPVIVHNGPAPGIIAEESEADLDVEWSGGVAPMAEIDFVVSEDTQTVGGLELSSLYVVDNNSDDIMSLSFGACETALGTENVFFNALWEQAAAQGITVTVSSGDPGSAGCDNFNTATTATHGLAVSGIASTPFNIAVGGTDFDDVGTQATFWNQNPGANDPVTRLSVMGYIPETTWNDSCAATATTSNLTTCVSPGANLLNIVAGSGGPSTCGIVNSTTGACVSGYPKPPWQTGTGVPADGVRDTPDVSLFASDGLQSKSFYVVCEKDAVSSNSCSSTGSFSFIGVGGTSASAPSFAGILALIEQSERTRVPGSSGRQGNANFVLYKIAQTAGNSCSSSSRTVPTVPPPAGCVFNDVTKGNNSVPCAGASPNCSSTTSGTNGVLFSTIGTTKTPAFTTTAGYDLATGLGSVNVANLASAWGTAVGAFKATTTSTKVNGSTTPAPIPHGMSVTLSATVTSGSGTPTGDVSFPVPTVVNGGVGDATLSGGTASLATTFLPGGSYTLKAHYAGDGNFAPSDDPTGVPVMVNKENSRLQYGIVTFDPVSGVVTSTNATSVVYGSPYILRIDILNSTTNACQPLVTNGVTTGCAVDATGTVTITDNGSPLDTGAFVINSAGHAEDQPIQLTGGTNILSATYSGDISYNPVVTSVTDTVTVSKAATQVSALTANPSTGVTTATPVALTATISSTSNSALGTTGTVTFFNGGVQIGAPAAVTPFGATASAGAGGTATLTTTFTSAGTKTITAQYNGDVNYALSAVSSSITVTVTQAQVGSFTVSYSPQPLVLSSMTGAAAAVTVTVTPVGGFTGTVAVTASTLPPGVTCTPSPLNINVAAATAVTGQLSCMVAATSTTLTASNAPQDRVLEAKTTPPTTPGKGWWALSAGTGFAALFLLFLPGGRKRYRAALGLGLMCILTFTMGCSSTGSGGGGGGGGLTGTVTKLTVPSAKVASGTAFTFSVAVTGGTPGGIVELFDNGTMIGTTATVAGGTSTPTAPALTVGTHSINAHYLGDASTKASASGTLNLTVTGSTTIAITTSPVASPVAPAINVTIN